MGEIAEVGEVGEVREVTEVSEFSKASKVRNFTNDCCDVSRPALDHLDYQGGRQRTELRDKDRPGNDPQLVPGFPSRSSVIRTSFFCRMGCFSANSRGSQRALLSETNVSFNSDVMLIGTSVLRNL